MKKILFLSVIALAFAACSNDKAPEEVTETAQPNMGDKIVQKAEEIVARGLNGSWAPVKQEMSGTPIPEDSFKKQLLTIEDTTYTMVAEGTDKGILKYADGKMDIYGKEGANKGRHIMAIYKVEDGKLIICYNLMGTGYPEGYNTRGIQMCFMSEFEKK